MKFKKQQGAAAIEFAIIFPIFFLIFYAIITYGLIFAAQQRRCCTNAGRS